MKQKFKSSRSEMDVRGSNDREPRVEDLVDVYKFPAKQWVQVRFVGPLISYGRHWIETKKADGSKTSFPKTCLSYDPETEEHDSTKSCPWCDVSDERVRFGPAYYQNAIIREIEEDGPSKKAAKQSKTETKSGIKDRGSKAWTPVRVISLTGSMIRQIKKLGGLNRHKDKKTGEKKAFSVSHVKYGCDISIQFDPEEKEASKKYSFQKGDASKLSEEQQEYLMYQIEGLMTPEKKDAAKADVKRWLEKMGKKKSKDDDSDGDDDGDDDDSDDEDEDEDEPKGKSKKNKGKDAKKGKGKKSKSEDDDDEDDDDLPEEDDDEDDEPKKNKGKDKKKGKKSKSEDDKDEDSDDDDDLDEDDDDEEDEPKGKSKKNKGKKSKDDDDEDDDDLDDDDELDDEDDDEPKGKGKKNKGKKSKSEDEDDDEDEDEDSDDDEDEEDDEPKKKGKGKDKKKGKGKKSKDEDDDDLDDEDD